MPDLTTRRTLLATAVGAAATLSGCSGDGGDDGGGGPAGELDVEETIDEQTSWVYELESGQTITVEVDAIGMGTDASINHAEDPSGGTWTGRASPPPSRDRSSTRPTRRSPSG